MVLHYSGDGTYQIAAPGEKGEVAHNAMCRIVPTETYIYCLRVCARVLVSHAVVKCCGGNEWQRGGLS